MTDLTNLTISESLEKLKSKEISPVELTNAYIKKLEENEKYNAYVTMTPDIAIEQAKESEKRYLNSTNKALDGIALGIKDLFCTKGIRTTACSKMIDNFVPQYESTVTQKLLNDGAVFLGKLNLDEFAMGGSNETSYFGPVVNPWSKDVKLVAGGSSGGSADAVAANMCAGATGTDTGGSIRQPSAFCGVTGIKPTYGRCSRYGVIAFASSLDQPGPICKDVKDCALMLNSMAGFDEKDATSSRHDVPNFESFIGQDIKGLKIGIPREYIGKKTLAPHYLANDKQRCHIHCRACHEQHQRRTGRESLEHQGNGNRYAACCAKIHWNGKKQHHEHTGKGLVGKE